MKNKIGLTIIFILLIGVIMLLFAGIMHKLNAESLNECFYLLGDAETKVEYGNKYDELGYVAQDNTLFPDTIENNMTMFNSKLDEKVKRVVKQVEFENDLKKSQLV